MSVALITSCSNRKSCPADLRLRAFDLPEGSHAKVAEVWCRRVAKLTPTKKAGQLYSSRGPAIARKLVAEDLCSNWIVSAGLGLLGSDELAPGYDLTVTGDSENNIQSKIKGEIFDPQIWWSQIAANFQNKNSIKRIASRDSASLIVIALPANYLRMIANDLRGIGQKNRNKLRILGCGLETVPDDLREYWIPYDSRLDGPDSPIPGTKSDFSHRAAQHFIEIILSNTESKNIKKHITLVTNSLEKLRLPITVKRKQLDDDEMKTIIRKLWSRADGQVGRMLRVLRDEEKIACEQGRFAKLFREVKEAKV